MRKAKLRKKQNRAVKSRAVFKLSRCERWKAIMYKQVQVISRDNSYHTDMVSIKLKYVLVEFCEFLAESNAYALLDTKALHYLETHTEQVTKMVSWLRVNYSDKPLAFYKRLFAEAYYKITGDNPTSYYMPERKPKTLGCYWPKK